MPSASSGKYKIKSIKVYKDHVTLSFLKHARLQISKEAYLSSYLYEGKSISEKEINKLNEPTRFPNFREACKNFTMDEIFAMAEATYRMEVALKGGVIDE